jgi:Flp pilus assembly pilin Flp
MKTLFKELAQQTRGTSAIEFALLAPALFMMMVGITQIGFMSFASAGLKFAVAEGARFATTHPRPTIPQIEAKVKQRRFGIAPDRFRTFSIVEGVSDSAQYYDITVTYTVPLKFVFVEVPPVILRETRRAYIYALPVT